MAEQQFCTITARIQDGAVVFSSRDPNLTQGSDGAWTFQINTGTPSAVVFQLDIDDGGNGWTVRSSYRVDTDTWSSAVDWTRDRVYTSPAFVHGNDFRLEVARSRSSTSTVRGSGFYQVRGEGGGDPF